jgi:hypothetical protein
MNLKNLQLMQLFWVGLGLAYNAISYLSLSSGASALSPTDPLAGSLFVSFIGLIVLAGLFGFGRLYKFLLPASALLLLYSGVGLHVLAIFNDSSLLGYTSFMSWFFAILINLYGATTLLLGSWFAIRSLPTISTR